MKIFYSIFSGIIYNVYDCEVINLDEGQIPLIGKPSCNCKKCFGRGYSNYDTTSGIYPVCKCMIKYIDPEYKPTDINLLPKL